VIPALQLVREARGELAAAGVPSAGHDAEALAAHVVGAPRGRLLLARMDAAAARRYRTLVARRAAREPLQHLLGTAVLGPVEVVVGPGVFVPRPETELLVAWGLAALRELAAPLVVDLCAGSAAIALAVAAARGDAMVHAVEADPVAAGWAARNIGRAGGQVVLHVGEVGAPDLLPELCGRVDLVLCNPPYVPDGTVVAPEVGHDPARAVFGGPDGLDVVRDVVTAAPRLLAPGGRVGIEHDDTHGAAVPALLRAGGLVEVSAHRDLAGRPRFATARRP